MGSSVLSPPVERLPPGLSTKEAARRLEADGPNELPSARPRSLFAIGLDVLREPMLFLLVASAVTYLLLGDLEESLALVAAVLVVVGITLYQENKTERTLFALRELSSPRALVVRDGERTRIAGRDVVRGDVLILGEGDRVAADATVVSASGLTADESLLTGESIPVRKRPDDEQPRVYLGTLITSGYGVAQVDATGGRTEIGRIGKALATIETSRTALEAEVSRVVRILAALGITSCIVVAVAYGLTQHRWLDGVLAGLTMAISMIPEEFPVILTIFLALGAWRISQSRVLTRRFPAIETLGSATVLCSDKTGTLTMNRMAVAAVFANGDLCNFEGDSTPQVLPEACARAVQSAALSCRPAPFDPMERAILELADRLRVADERHEWTLVREYPMTDALMAVCSVWSRSPDAAFLAAAKGAPEAILDMCRTAPAARIEILRQVDALATQGLRVLAVARSAYRPGDLPESPRAFPFEFLGLVALADPIRPTVPAAIDECRTAGVRVIMITGDHPSTALHIAKQIGLARSGTCLTGADIARLDDGALRRQVIASDVFARILATQKLRIVQALEANGDVVAMTGDGVNDAPALKAAHIGIAMGGRGTDVAREAASLILMDDDFSSIVRAMRLGRRIYDNIAKAMAYVLSIHVPIAAVSLVPALFGWPLVLLPVHVIFMELIVDPACSVAFEMEPEEADVMRRPPRDPRRKLFNRRFVVRSLLQGAGAAVVSLVVLVWARWWGADALHVRTLTFATLIMTNLMLIATNLSLRRRFAEGWKSQNIAFIWLAGSALAALCAALFVPRVRELFLLAPTHAADIGVWAIAAVATLAWLALVKRCV